MKKQPGMEKAKVGHLETLWRMREGRRGAITFRALVRRERYCTRFWEEDCFIFRVTTPPRFRLPPQVYTTIKA